MALAGWLAAVVVLAACEKRSSSSTPNDDPAPPTTAPVSPAVAPALGPTAEPATTLATTPASVASGVALAAVDAGRTSARARTTDGTRPGEPKPANARPASKRTTGKNFALDVTAPGCRAGDDCTMAIRLIPEGEFHVNKEYPYRFIATPAANVTYLGKSDPATFARASGDFTVESEKAATMTVHFRPRAGGETHIAGKYKLSVCSAEQCQIEEALVDLPITVL